MIKEKIIYEKNRAWKFAVLMAVVLCACGEEQELADISTAEGDRYTIIIWEERTYVPYYAVLKKDGGALITKENITANQPILDVIRTFTEKKEATSAQISLAWMLHKYPNCVPIPGSKNQERILENLGA